MIEQVVAQWHAYLRGELAAGLDELLDDEVVFYSPIVFTPQRGKQITSLYLQAAAQTFPGDGTKSSPKGTFRAAASTTPRPCSVTTSQSWSSRPPWRASTSTAST